MDETMLTLKPGVRLIEAGTRVGLVMNERVRYAKNERQAEILRALLLQSRSPECLTALLQTRCGLSENDNEISLAIAEFILNFGEYIKA